MKYTEFELWNDMITLGQLIKALGFIHMGGEVKAFLASETILVNSQPESRRGRKLYPEDVITLPDGNSIRIVSKGS